MQRKMTYTVYVNYLLHSLIIFEMQIKQRCVMPLISKQTLKSFLGENSFITGVDDIAGLSDAIAQADNMVYQKTLIAIPAVTLDAIPTLQFCSHAICLYLISFRQNLKEEEIKRRDLLY